MPAVACAQELRSKLWEQAAADLPWLSCYGCLVHGGHHAAIVTHNHEVTLHVKLTLTYVCISSLVLNSWQRALSVPSHRRQSAAGSSSDGDTSPSSTAYSLPPPHAPPAPPPEGGSGRRRRCCSSDNMRSLSSSSSRDPHGQHRRRQHL